jgi:hypothetical protein
MAPEFCSFAFWSNIPFLVPSTWAHQILGANINMVFTEHLYSNTHSQTQTEETDSCLWIPTCYWMRHSLFYSFYYSRTRWSLMSRHTTGSWCLVLVVVNWASMLFHWFTQSHNLNHQQNTRGTVNSFGTVCAWRTTRVFCHDVFHCGIWH